MAMEFWGVEVKAGVPFEVKPDPGQVVHISHAALGETTTKEVKGAKSIPLRLKIDDKDMILGFLKPEERTHLSFDLVFEKQFMLSHEWKNGSIHFTGYLGPNPTSDTENSSDESEDELEKDSPAAAPAPAPVVNGDAPVSDSDDDEDSEDDSDEFLSGDSSDSEEEEDELPKEKVQQSKKRPHDESAAPVSARKAKSITPEETCYKNGQKATPSKAPAVKNATGKTPPGNKSKQSSGGGGGGHSGKKGKRGGK